MDIVIETVIVGDRTYSAVPFEGLAELGVGPDEIADLARPVLRQNAEMRIDKVHAAFMLDLTGGATAEERDTWPRKLLAALAVESGDERELHLRVLRMGALQRGITIADHAGRILKKDKAYASLVDAADALRERAKVAVRDATVDGASSSEMSAQLEVVFEQMAAEAQTAVVSWKAAVSGASE